MTTHLTDDEVTTVLCEQDIPKEARHHLQTCLSCRRRVVSFQHTISARRAEMERDMPDWQDQKQTILRRLPNQEARTLWHTGRWTRSALAAAAVAILALAAGLFRHPTTPSLLPTPSPELSIEQILAQTESLLADESIPGFEVFAEIDDADLDALLPALESS